jgi:Flp pilus assembly CpaE family ATPase
MLGVPIFHTILNDYAELYETYAEGRMVNRNSDLGKQIARLAMKLGNIEEDKSKDKKRFGLFG